MNICVISDTHGNIGYLEKLNTIISGKIEILIHLGDESSDVNGIINPGIKTITVPGIYEHHYRNKNTARRIIETINNIKFLLTHTPYQTNSDLPGELTPEQLSTTVNIVLFGHTHTPTIEIKNKILWINPGHIKSEYDRGNPASYCIINTNNPVSIKIYELLTNNILLDYSYNIPNF